MPSGIRRGVLEAARIAVTRYMQRQGQIWIRIFPDKPITKKPAEVRMGKGKGSPEGFVAPAESAAASLGACLRASFLLGAGELGREGSKVKWPTAVP